MEKLGYFFIALGVVLWGLLVIFGIIQSPIAGIFGGVFIIGFGILLIKVLQDRAHNKEDDFYDKNVEK